MNWPAVTWLPYLTAVEMCQYEKWPDVEPPFVAWLLLDVLRPVHRAALDRVHAVREAARRRRAPGFVSSTAMSMPKW